MKFSPCRANWVLRKRMEWHILHTPGVTAFHSGSVSHHCKSRPVLLALLPAWADTRVISRQGITIYMMISLRTTCLVGVSHPHDPQDMIWSNALRHPAPKEQGYKYPQQLKENHKTWVFAFVVTGRPNRDITFRLKIKRNCNWFKEASRGFEPRSLDSESRVLTVTPRGQMLTSILVKMKAYIPDGNARSPITLSAVLFIICTSFKQWSSMYGNVSPSHWRLWDWATSFELLCKLLADISYFRPAQDPPLKFKILRPAKNRSWYSPKSLVLLRLPSGISGSSVCPLVILQSLIVGGTPISVPESLEPDSEGFLDPGYASPLTPLLFLIDLVFNWKLSQSCNS